MTEWQQLFTSLDHVYSNVAKLLHDSDHHLGLRGYDVAHKVKSNIGSEQSDNLGTPARWYPTWVSRAYLKRGMGLPESPLLFVAVLLHSHDGDDLPSLPEPIVTAGAFRYGPDSGTDWHHWMAKAWAWGEDRPCDGTVVTRGVPKASGVEGQVFARPITELADLSAVEEKIITPLLTLI